MRLGLSIMLMVFLAGCATTQQSTEVNRLQLQVSQLEQKLQEREDQIDELKYEIQQSAGQNDNFDSEEVVEPNFEESAGKDAASRRMDSAKDKRIIRVSATPQQVQEALKNAGYYTGSIDGKIGSKTQDAIKAFQTEHALKSDGIVGNKTWIEMKNYLQ